MDSELKQVLQDLLRLIQELIPADRIDLYTEVKLLHRQLTKLERE